MWEQKLFDHKLTSAQTPRGTVFLQTINLVRLVWPKDGTFQDPIMTKSPRQATVTAEMVLDWDFGGPLEACVAKMRETAGQLEGDFDSEGLVEQYLVFTRQRHAEVKRSIGKFIEDSLESNGYVRLIVRSCRANDGKQVATARGQARGLRAAIGSSCRISMS